MMVPEEQCARTQDMMGLALADSCIFGPPLAGIL